MRKALFILCLLFLSEALMAATTAKIRYPFVENLKGRAVLVEETLKIENRKSVSGEKEVPLRAKMNLKDKAFIWVKDNSELTLKLSSKNMLVIYPETRVEIPRIDWEKGLVTDVRLVAGSLRWICKMDCGLKISTQISTNIFPQGDFLLEYTPEVPQVTLTVLEGSTSFSGLDNEVSLSLSAGERASFQGVLENKEPAFDLLLQGRKVAKGKLGAIEKVDVAKWLEAKAVKVKSQANVVKPKNEPKNPKQICSAPSAQFGQCAWICEGLKKNSSGKKKISECDLSSGAKCVRLRCDANGQWSDRAELAHAENKCRTTAIVETCDY